VVVARGIPIAAALFVLGSYAIDPDWNGRWMTGESGILETAQFVFMVIGLAIAVQLLFSPFVRRRPLVLALTAVAALACLFIGGEEVSWGQHIFFWQEPSLVTAVNEKGELSLHNMNKGFERGPHYARDRGVRRRTGRSAPMRLCPLAQAKPGGTVPARSGASAHRSVRLSVQACRPTRGT
jgi:hypothetical protein